MSAGAALLFGQPFSQLSFDQLLGWICATLLNFLELKVGRGFSYRSARILQDSFDRAQSHHKLILFLRCLMTYAISSLDKKTY